MSLEIKKRGYTKKDLCCPNCDMPITVFLDDKEIIRKVYGAELLGTGVLSDYNEIKCIHCSSVLSYKKNKEN